MEWGPRESGDQQGCFVGVMMSGLLVEVSDFFILLKFAFFEYQLNSWWGPSLQVPLLCLLFTEPPRGGGEGGQLGASRADVSNLSK